ncbi:MAG TPA: dicarboxylate/amino acid:cation symporter [Candidatus Saccharimonadales bacterium]|nr:dicarboxylate/amino acid:cation symporter [Candidatus Saccharimonadales bacterium]
MSASTMLEHKQGAGVSNEGRPWYGILYVQVLVAVALGIGIGYAFPEFGKSLRPLGDGFIKLVKMIIAPIIFCTVVHGIASMRDGKKLGRLGVKTILYFEIVSTFALMIGLVVVNVWKPGVGFPYDPSTVDAAIGKSYVEKGHAQTTVDFLLNIIPKSFFDAFASGDILQVLLISILSGFAISFMGETGKPVLLALARGERIFFGIMHIIVKVAPLAALGSMGYTVGSYGVRALHPLVSLMAGFYVTAAIFVVVVLGLIARFAGFSIFSFISYIREELLLVLGTSSSETALPSLLEKLRRLGCAETTVGFVVPTGYSFNLDGTNIYMTMAAIFLAQATNTPLTLGHQITLLLVAMLSSKGATGVTGAGFIALAATLAAVPSIPVSSLALLVGIDRFMSECRALTNLIGNGVATIVISRWEGELSAAKLNEMLRKPKSILDLPPGGA